MMMWPTKKLKVIVILVIILENILLLGCLAKRPNFLFVISDDMRLINPFEDELNAMPSIQAFARGTRGTRGGAFFTNAHSQMAMCSPSRSSLMSGLRPDSTKLYQINSVMRKSKTKITTIAEALKKSGYRTIGVGKIMDGRVSGGWQVQDFPLSWSQRVNNTKSAAWDKNLTMPNCGYGDARFHPKTNKKPFTQCAFRPDVRIPRAKIRVPSRDGLPDYDLLQVALDTLDDLSKKPDEPFFLAVGLLRPHLPFVAPQSHFARWPREIFTNHTQYPYHPFRDDVYQPPLYRNREFSTYTGWTIKAKKPGPLAGVNRHARAVHSYIAACSMVDEVFDSLVAALDSKPPEIRDNTVVIFFSDHGYHLGEHGIYGKKTVYEAATRVPLLIMGSMFSNMVRVDSPVELIDLMPTIMQLAQVTDQAPSPLGYQGISLLPLFESSQPVKKVKAVALAQFYGFNGYGKLMSYAFRGSRYRFVVHYRTVQKKILFSELYDYKTDPRELTNLLTDPTVDTSHIAPKFHALFRLYLDDMNEYHHAISQDLLDEDF